MFMSLNVASLNVTVSKRKSFNQQRQLINHALKAFILLIRTQKIKDIKEQMPNKLIKLENNK